MQSRPSPLVGLALSLWFAWAAFVATAAPAGSGFTYQGRLVDSGLLAEGNYELTFRLFDDVAAGAQVGSDVVRTPVAVSKGLFTVELDFGADAFDGSSRWLQVSARLVGDAGAPETLGARQPVTAVPYALRSLGAAGDLLTLSNALTARIDELAAQVTALSAAVTVISNQVKPLPPTGVTVVSNDPEDPTLTSDGWVRFGAVAAPGWRTGAGAGAPGARSQHSAVWTGSSLLVWGGATGGLTPNGTGAGYDPDLDEWSPIATIPGVSPPARRGHAAVWTGEAMLIWGGFSDSYLADGFRYDPVTLGWTPMTGSNVPEGRLGQVSAWTGERLVVWGGVNSGGLLGDGGVYDPSGDAWVDLPLSGAPESRTGAAGVWTGGEFIVWGGVGDPLPLGTGGRIRLTNGITAGTWTALPTGGAAPGPRSSHTAVWTGSRMLVWGGKDSGGTPLDSGAAYDPVADAWTSIPAGGAPAARSGHLAVWNGVEMLVFGGEANGQALASGGAYNPATGVWRPLSTAGAPLARSVPAGAWTGSEMLVFGGLDDATPVASLQRLNPEPTWYFYRKP